MANKIMSRLRPYGTDGRGERGVDSGDNIPVIIIILCFSHFANATIDKVFFKRKNPKNLIEKL
jgi:hypothetical protein